MRPRWVRLVVSLAAVALVCSLVVADAGIGRAGAAAARSAGRFAAAGWRSSWPPSLGGPDALRLPPLSGKAAPFTGTAAVGALFVVRQGRPVRHFCTASVVHSHSGDLLITAAHCMTGLALSAAVGVGFAPGYHDGVFPHGLWVVTSEFVTTRWTAQHDPNDDVAFLVVGGPLAQPTAAPALPGLTVTLEQAVGAEELGLAAPLPAPAEVIGYPDAASRPVRCATTIVAFGGGTLNQMSFACGGFTDGTSGGPLLTGVSQADGTGTIIGVIGGYEQGGRTPDVSYSAVFAANVGELYRRADAPAQLQGPPRLPLAPAPPYLP